MASGRKGLPMGWSKAPRGAEVATPYNYTKLFPVPAHQSGYIKIDHSIPGICYTGTDVPSILHHKHHGKWDVVFLKRNR